MKESQEFIIDDKSSITDLTNYIGYGQDWKYKNPVTLTFSKNNKRGNFQRKVTITEINGVLDTVKVFEENFPNWIRPDWTYPRNLI